MHIKVSQKNEITVTCVGKTKKEVLKDLADASAFVEGQLDVAVPKAVKKRKPRKKKAAMKPPSPVLDAFHKVAEEKKESLTNL